MLNYFSVTYGFLIRYYITVPWELKTPLVVNISNKLKTNLLLELLLWRGEVELPVQRMFLGQQRVPEHLPAAVVVRSRVEHE